MSRIITFKTVDFKGRMKKKNFTFKELSDLTNIDLAHLCKIANDKMAMTQDTWDRIKKFI